MILEGIVTTRNSDGSINVAPMGPIVDESMTSLRLRPFQSSQTYRNLNREPAGVFHVVDDVLLLVRAALNLFEEAPPTSPAEVVTGAVLQDACRWYEFRVTTLDDSEQRTNIRCEVVHTGRLRDFFGWNRARHAVLEAAILATRVGILPQEEIDRQLEALEIIVGKTAGPAEQQAFELVTGHVAGLRQSL